MLLKGTKRTSYTLIEPSIASGGEGIIYNIKDDPSLVAKLWKSTEASPENTLRSAKIQEMVRLPQAEKCVYIIWPKDVLFDDTGKTVGFVMNRCEHTREMADYLPEPDLNWRRRVRVAINLCDVVRETHEMGQCIGDMNPRNFGISKENGHVFAFDVDSFHFVKRQNSGKDQYYPCVVGLPEYYAPELQALLADGRTLKMARPDKTFTVQTDRFALAVLIFQLLFKGYHPFAARLLETAGSSTVVHKQSTAILKKISPYFNPAQNTGIPKGSPSLDIVPETMRSMFKKAFLEDDRPSAMEWQRALLDLDEQETQCPTCKDYYYKKLPQCPWCKIKRPESPLPPPPPPGPIDVPVICIDDKKRVIKSTTVSCKRSQTTTIKAPVIAGYNLTCTPTVLVKVDANGKTTHGKVRFTYQKKKQSNDDMGKIIALSITVLLIVLLLWSSANRGIHRNEADYSGNAAQYSGTTAQYAGDAAQYSGTTTQHTGNTSQWVDGNRITGLYAYGQQRDQKDANDLLDNNTRTYYQFFVYSDEYDVANRPEIVFSGFGGKDLSSIWIRNGDHTYNSERYYSWSRPNKISVTIHCRDGSYIESFTLEDVYDSDYNEYQCMALSRTYHGVTSVDFDITKLYLAHLAHGDLYNYVRITDVAFCTGYSFPMRVQKIR